MSRPITPAWEHLIAFCRTHRYLRVKLRLQDGEPVLCESDGQSLGLGLSRAWQEAIETCQRWQAEVVTLNIAEGEPVMIRRDLSGPVMGQFETTVKLPAC